MSIKTIIKLCLISVFALIPYTNAFASTGSTEAAIDSSKEVAILGTQRRQARREGRQERREERRDDRYERRHGEPIEEEPMPEDAVPVEAVPE